MFQRVAARLGRADEDAQLLFDLVLVDVLVVGEALGPERCLERPLLAGQRGRRGLPHLGHFGHAPTIPAIFSAALARETSAVSVAFRRLSSALPSVSERLLTVTRSGMPMRSASANFTPALSSRSS